MAISITSRTPHGGGRVDRALHVFLWLLILISPLIGLALRPEGDDVDHAQLLFVQVLVWVVLLTRLVLALRRWPTRRAALAPLTAGVLLWAIASATLNGSGNSAYIEFPSVHEVFFFASYAGFVLFLTFDVVRRHRHVLTAWLDATIVCGGVGALAAAALLHPIGDAYPDGGLPLFVAALYPVLDLTLALFVLGQWALASRTTSWRTFTLVAAFVTLAVADMSLVINLSGGTYAFTILLDVLWGAAFILLVDAGVAQPRPLPRIPRQLSPRFIVLSFVSALVVLFVRPEGPLGVVAAIPAVLALLATGARLAVAQRDSRRATEALHLAQTDDLTGLPNRRALLANLDVALRDKGAIALVLLDLDGFKEVNDTLGHSAGDALLELVAGRLRDAIDPEPFIARVGGDEFAIILEGDDLIHHVEVARTIRSAIIAPMRLDGVGLMVLASLGITTRQRGDTSAVDLLRRADIAMYGAKATKTGVQVYDASHDEFSHQRLRMAEEMRRGLAKGQFVLHYQPQVDALTQMVTGMEALIRWEHPTDGLIPPVAFLSVARRAGLMQALSEFVARQAIMEAKNWEQSGLSFGVSMNIAPPELLGGQLLPMIYELSDRIGLPAHRLTIEVTEDSFLTDPARAKEVLLDVRDHGLKIAIDDYGTGFSSLSYLRDLPVTEVKLDRSFVASVGSDDRSRQIVGSTIDMVHALDLELVAEGVESATVSAEMLALGADTLQGYHISPPLPVTQVADWVRAWTASTRQFRPL